MPQWPHRIKPGEYPPIRKRDLQCGQVTVYPRGFDFMLAFLALHGLWAAARARVVGAVELPRQPRPVWVKTDARRSPKRRTGVRISEPLKLSSPTKTTQPRSAA